MNAPPTRPQGKSIVDMSTVDVATVQRLAEGVKSAGGRYLEAPVNGSKKPVRGWAVQCRARSGLRSACAVMAVTA